MLYTDKFSLRDCSGFLQMESHLWTTVEPVYYVHLGTNHKYPDYQGVLIIQVSFKAHLGP